MTLEVIKELPEECAIEFCHGQQVVATTEDYASAITGEIVLHLVQSLGDAPAQRCSCLKVVVGHASIELVSDTITIDIQENFHSR